MTGDAMTLRLASRHMKSRILWSWGLGVVVAALLLVGGRPQEASTQATNTTPAPEREAHLAEAAVKPISSGKPLPPNIKPAGPVSEVINLVASGVDESVMMAFVTNSTNPFNLGVEEIIYLNNLGVPGSVVAAMIRQDQMLKELSAGSAAAPAGPAAGTPANQFAPEPGAPKSYALQPAAAFAPPEMAPEAAAPEDYATEGYPPPPAADTDAATIYDSPASYGTWVVVAGYGPRWQPTVVVNASGRPSARTIGTGESVPAPGSVAPLILHGPDSSRGVTGWSTGAVRETYPPNALVIIGRKEVKPWRMARQSPAWAPEPPQPRATALSQDALPQSRADLRPQPVRTAAWVAPARSEPAWSPPRSTEPPARREYQRPYAAPSRNGR
jgi:hypothetical protein